ncbi:MAG: P-loop NTPase fold protein [Proteobacteria bacterium]|nr:P-loop NTPase fold protein [Pseudomonadota bacterium]
MRSLAELVCLEDSEPPLAIGLFGDWGSGKSTFMEMLRSEVDTLTQERESRPHSPFVTNVSHIWFNAWHYNDANLWASLVSHIFRELHRQATDLTEAKNWLKEDQFKELLKKFNIVQESERQATAQLVVLKRDIATTETELKKIEKSRGEANKKLIQAHTSALVDAIEVKDPDHKVADALDSLGLGSQTPDARRLREVVEEGQKLTGRAQLLFASMQGWGTRPFRYAVLGLAVLLVIGGGSATLLTWLGSEEYLGGLKDVAGTVGSVLGLASGALAWLLPHMKFVNEKFGPLIDAHNRVMQAEKAAEAARLELEKKTRGELEDLKVEQAQKERVLEEKKAEQEHYEAIARGDKPEELLNYFIADRASAEDYRARLGLLSRIREDFVTMSGLMGEQRERRRNPGGAMGFVQPDLPQIDRIILYIDDLDRCRHDKVVEVLEAIHLLLAFDLFVVVVGVDARWLHRSLEQSYASQLSQAANGLNHFSGHATPGDYLEKIFQIPFWLKPLRFDEGGTYRKLVASLVGEVLVTKPPARAAGSDTDEPQPGGALESGPGLEIVDAEFPAPPEETEAETAARIQFTDVEVDLINELGPMAGKSPRAVKRMINLYRLIRVGFRGPALDAFLNDRDGVNYPEVLFWLAMETGCPRAGLAKFIEYLHTFDADIAELERRILDESSSTMMASSKGKELRFALNDACEKIASALTAANSARGDTLTVEDLRNAYPVTMRFSFQQEYSRTMTEA